MATDRSESLWYRLRWPFALLAALLLYGIAGYTLLEGWSVLDAIFMTVTTLTTVGFREVRPLDTSGQVFTTTLIVFGFTTVFLIVSLTAGWIAEAGIGSRMRRRRMDRRIDDLRDHYIICAYGRVGRAIAREFEAEGAPFVVIDTLETLADRMERDGVLYMIADPSQEDVLRHAGVERAKGLVCAVDSDATNVYITLLARSLNADLFIVARASERGSDERLVRAGADRVVSPFVSSGRHMALVALRPRVTDVVEVEAGGARSMKLEEVNVDAASELIGRRVADLGSMPVLAIRHAGGQITPNPDDDVELEPGDLVLLLGEQELPSVRRPS